MFHCVSRTHGGEDLGMQGTCGKTPHNSKDIIRDVKVPNIGDLTANTKYIKVTRNQNIKN
jgi:hypothetical protein